MTSGHLKRANKVWKVVLVLNLVLVFKSERPYYQLLTHDEIFVDFTVILCGFSLHILTEISVDRLIALSLGLRYRQIVTLKRARSTVTVFACVRDERHFTILRIFLVSRDWLSNNVTSPSREDLSSFIWLFEITWEFMSLLKFNSKACHWTSVLRYRKDSGNGTWAKPPLTP